MRTGHYGFTYLNRKGSVLLFICWMAVVNFRSVVGMIHHLSSANGNTVCPEMMVVAILNTDRARDLTPTKGDINHPYVDQAPRRKIRWRGKFYCLS